MEFRRIFEILPYQKTNYPQKKALVYKVNNKWTSFSIDDVINQANHYSAGLLDIGIQRRDKVALLFHQGAPHWVFLDFAIQQLGAIVVPIHTTSSVKEMEHLLKDAEIKICITSNTQLFQKIKQASEGNKTLQKIYCQEAVDDANALAELNILPTHKHQAKMVGLRAAVHEDDIATIIYTAGTTGNPKGVMLSHKNLISNIKVTNQLLPINVDKRTFSFLPPSYAFERMVIYAYLASGASIHFAERMDSILSNIQEIRPHFFTSVPRIFEQLYDLIILQGADMGKSKNKILLWAIKVGEQFQERPSFSPIYAIRKKVANLLVYRKWRKMLGGKIEGVVIGAAPLPINLAKIFAAAGIDIKAGYGLTEAGPAIAFNQFNTNGSRIGTVGKSLPGVDVKLVNVNKNGEGEIIVKGPNVMKGYYNKPELTKQVVDEDGWLYTGDIGKFVQHEFLQIIGRKKVTIKTTSGKIIAPKSIERKLVNIPIIKQAIIVGFDKPFVTALIVLDFDKLKIWCSENGVNWIGYQFIIHHLSVTQYLEELIESINDQLKATDKIRKFSVLENEWTIASGELTPNLTLERKVILNNYASQIEEMYEKNLTY